MEKIKLNKSELSIINSLKATDDKTIFVENNNMFGYYSKTKLNIVGKVSLLFVLYNKGIIVNSKNGYILNSKIEWINDKTIKIPMSLT